jgi:hypothetical protein
MTTSQPVFNGATKPNNATGVTPVPTAAQRKVTYIFQCVSASKVNLPYAIAVNNKVLAAYEKKTSRVSSGKSGNVLKPGKFTVTVDQGAKVVLYLNSDAHPSYRKNPVYEVTTGEKDIEVKVTEKTGLNSDSDTPILVKDKVAAVEAAKKIDTYTAHLTGDIWMKISHKYTSAEVDALMPAGTAPEIVTAIKSIYDGLKSSSLTISIPATKDKAVLNIVVKFEDSQNPTTNIKNGYSLLDAGLTRVHPGGYAALFNAASDSSVEALTVTSCWRPMLGSIAHRAGLGLDVNYVGKTRMNRQELRGGVDTTNVSPAEIKAFKEYEAAITANKKPQLDLKTAKAGLAAAKKTNDPLKIAAAEAKKQTAQEAATKTENAQAESQKVWNETRDASEPASVKSFRTHLLKCSCVAQLFDPWFMDENTKDDEAPQANMQKGASTSNERLHSHHLHITVHEPQIL